MFGALFSWSINTKRHTVEFPLDYRLPFMLLSVCLIVILVMSVLLPQRINGAKQIADEKLKLSNDL